MDFQLEKVPLFSLQKIESETENSEFQPGNMLSQRIFAILFQFRLST